MELLTVPTGAALCAPQDFRAQQYGALTLGGVVDLAIARVHEAMGDAADMFAVAVAAQLKGPIVWIGSERQVESLAPTALQKFLDPARLILTTGVSRNEVLWATEKALQSGGVASVVAEVGDGPDLQTSRRLQIAAEEGGALGIVIVSGRAQTSAAQTRWLCEARCDEGAPWEWRLTKNKGGMIGAWRVNWLGEEHAPDFVHMAAVAAA